MRCRPCFFSGAFPLPRAVCLRTSMRPKSSYSLFSWAMNPGPECQATHNRETSRAARYLLLPNVEKAAQLRPMRIPTSSRTKKRYRVWNPRKSSVLVYDPFHEPDETAMPILCLPKQCNLFELCDHPRIQLVQFDQLPVLIRSNTTIETGKIFREGFVLSRMVSSRRDVS